ARLSADGRSVLDAVAIVPPSAELWLLESLTDASGLEECLSSGMLASAPGGISFRHELARLAIEDALPGHRRQALHERALAALLQRDPPDVARIAHHAEAAGDVDAVLEFAPAAAARAAGSDSKREAAAQYARALRFADRLDTDRRAELLEEYAYARYLV